jgi:hypothetical protein
MADPTMMAISAGMQVAGGVGGMKAGKASAKSAAQAAAFNNQVTGQNNELLAYQDQIAIAQLGRQAQLQMAVGKGQIDGLKEQYRRQAVDNELQIDFAKFYGRAGIGTATAQAGASGVSVSDGSPLMVRLVQESMLSKQVSGLELRGQLLESDMRGQIANAKFNQAVGLQNLTSEAAMQRTKTQIAMHNNTIDAMRNTMQGQAQAAKSLAAGRAALVKGIGGAATTMAPDFAGTGRATPFKPTAMFSSGATKVNIPGRVSISSFESQGAELLAP